MLREFPLAVPGYGFSGRCIQEPLSLAAARKGGGFCVSGPSLVRQRCEPACKFRAALLLPFHPGRALDYDALGLPVENLLIPNPDQPKVPVFSSSQDQVSSPGIVRFSPEMRGAVDFNNQVCALDEEIEDKEPTLREHEMLKPVRNVQFLQDRSEPNFGRRRVPDENTFPVMRNLRESLKAFLFCRGLHSVS